MTSANSTKRWLVKASRDLRAASAVLDLKPPLLDVAGFHCQQAIEKCFKFYLATKKEKIKKIHDLRALHDMALKVGWNHTLKNSTLDKISYCAVIVRYPDADDGKLTKRSVNQWRKIAQEVFDHLT